MAVIVRVAPARGGGGGSSATHYIVERELNKERESRETRLIFSDREDNLTPRMAHDFLADGAGRLDKEDLHQLIISFLPEEYERLGDNDIERRAALIQVTREAIRNLSAQDLEGLESRWAAGLHLNTPLPHLHILMRKEFIHPLTGERQVLQKFPRELLAERGSTIRDEDPARMGRISQRFSEALDIRSKPFRHVQIRDAEGEAIASREVIEAKSTTERQPTPEETIVGKWIVAEAHAARRKGQEAPPPLALREYVQKLDEQSAARGLSQTAAFLSKEQIAELRSYRTSALSIGFRTATTDRQIELERALRERPERFVSRGEEERRNFRRAHSLDGHEVRATAPKEALSESGKFMRAQKQLTGEHQFRYRMRVVARLLLLSLGLRVIIYLLAKALIKREQHPRSHAHYQRVKSPTSRRSLGCRKSYSRVAGEC